MNMAHFTQALRRGPELLFVTLAGLSLGTAACEGGSGSDDGTTATASASASASASATDDPTTADSGDSADETGGSGTDTADSGTEDTTDPSTTGTDEEAVCGNPGQGMVEGHVVIETAEDIAKIEGIAVVTGEVQVNRTNFEHIDFLVCLEQVGRSITIFGNDNLVDIEGLKNLKSVGEMCPANASTCGNIVISENASLTDMDGINELVELHGSLSISSNPSLEAITGLSSLVVIRENITIQYNDVLNNLSGFKALKAVGGNFSVTNNPSLCISKVNAMGEQLEQLLGEASTANNDDSC